MSDLNMLVLNARCIIYFDKSVHSFNTFRLA
uniref:Uncharacterized protein n=1 Tax=Rhizophora mucronata TaxID=61149 RepID=A0A2P2L0G6_RHIMU